MNSFSPSRLAAEQEILSQPDTPPSHTVIHPPHNPKQASGLCLHSTLNSHSMPELFALQLLKYVFVLTASYTKDDHPFITIVFRLFYP